MSDRSLRHQRALQKHVPGELAVFCWCEEEIVHVSPEDVLALRTKSCGLPQCGPPPAAGEVA